MNFLKPLKLARIIDIIKRYLYYRAFVLLNYENYDYDAGTVIAHLRVHIFFYMSFGVYQNNIYRHCPMSSARISQMKRLYFSRKVNLAATAYITLFSHNN